MANLSKIKKFWKLKQNLMVMKLRGLYSYLFSSNQLGFHCQERWELLSASVFKNV